jgi:hypothetical protein
MGKGLRLLGFLVLTAPLAACGGSSDDDDGGECGAVQGCGGDVVGVWSVNDLCVTNAPPSDQAECAGAISYGQVDATGQIEFTADGRLSTSLTLSMHVTYNFTGECLAAQIGRPVVVDQALCDGIEQQLSGTAMVTAASCSFSGGACVCPATFDTTTENESTYSISGTNLVGDDGELNPYCVSGDTLRIGAETDNGAVTYVLTRF